MAVAEATLQDRLTALPPDLKAAVLSLLPIDEAVRTCVLSRQWRRAWASVTDVRVYDRIGCRRRPSSYCAAAVRHILRSHMDSPIRTFALYHRLHPALADDFALLLLSLSVKPSLSSLFLCDADAKRETRFALRLPRFRFLRLLSLAWCSVDLSSVVEATGGGVGFDCLETLKLLRVRVDVSAVAALVSRCASLRRVSLLDINKSRSETISISSGILEELELGVNMYSNMIAVAFAPRLQTVAVKLRSFAGSMRSATVPYLVELLSVASGVRILTLNDLSVRCFSHVSMPDQLPSQLFGLKRLNLEVETVDASSLDAFACLLRNSPCLETLSIVLTGNLYPTNLMECKNRVVNMPEDFAGSNGGPLDCLDRSLSYVFISGGFELRRKRLLQLARFLLANAMKLKKMVIRCHGSSASDGKSMQEALAHELKQVERGSSSSELLVVLVGKEVL